MKITKAVSRFIGSLLCAVLIFNGLPLHAAGSGEELKHEAFLRGGDAIAVALTTPSASTPAVSRAIAEAMPAAPPAPDPAPAPARKQAGSKGISKLMWATLIGGFAAGGAIVYWTATGPGASIRNCSSPGCKD
jgi:hypothetical protein